MSRPELEDILRLVDGLTLDQLDAAARRFVLFCAAYHGECSIKSFWVTAI